MYILSLIVFFLFIISCASNNYILLEKSISLSGYLPYKSKKKSFSLETDNTNKNIHPIKNKKKYYEKTKIFLFNDNSILKKSMRFLQENQANKSKTILLKHIKPLLASFKIKINQDKIELLGKYYNNLAITMLILGQIVKANEAILQAGGYLQDNRIILNNLRFISSF